MSENISSSVLFHFTQSMGNIKSILKDGFYPHYCPEYTLDPDDHLAASKGRPPKYAIPLVSFCDLPLSLIKKHLNAYGNYGIGLKKHWGLKNGVAPVIYTHSRAKTRPPALRLTSKVGTSSDRTTAKDLIYIAAYTKPFRGAAWRDKKVKRRVMFYDEREWRYVPNIRWNQPLFLDGFVNTSTRNILHKQLKTKYTLAISPDDIQYLIVPDDKQVLELAKYISELGYGKNDAILVTTAIMTIDCIHQDI